MRGGDRPPPQLDLSDDVFLRHEAPVTAVGAVFPVITHHEVVTLGYDRRAEIVVAAELRRDESVVHRDIVHVHAAVHDSDGIAFFGNHALDERLVWIERVIEHDDVAAARSAYPIDELVDDQAILIFQRRRHAQAFDSRDLEAEGDDQCCVYRGREQRLEPGKQFVAPDVQLLHHPRRAVVVQRHLYRSGGFEQRRGGNSVRRQLQIVERRGLGGEVGYSFRYSRSRLVWERLTGISVLLASFILRM